MLVRVEVMPHTPKLCSAQTHAVAITAAHAPRKPKLGMRRPLPEATTTLLGVSSTGAGVGASVETLTPVTVRSETTMSPE